MASRPSIAPEPVGNSTGPSMGQEANYQQGAQRGLWAGAFGGMCSQGGAPMPAAQRGQEAPAQPAPRLVPRTLNGIAGAGHATGA